MAKRGEVDYRYMPDADLPPLVIGSDLVHHLKDTLPTLPDEHERQLQQGYGLSLKDAKTLIDLDDGDRIDYLEAVVDYTLSRIGGTLGPNEGDDQRSVGRMVCNWILHELGGLLTAHQVSWEESRLTAQELSYILVCLHEKQITMRVAKQLLADLFARPPAPEGTYCPGMGTRPTVQQLIDAGNLRLRPLSDKAYEDLAKLIMDDNPVMVEAVKVRGQKGKIMWFVGQMMRRGEEGTVEPERAKEVVERLMHG